MLSFKDANSFSGDKLRSLSHDGKTSRSSLYKVKLQRGEAGCLAESGFLTEDFLSEPGSGRKIGRLSVEGGKLLL